jgi:IMP dehydrogenase
MTEHNISGIPIVEGRKLVGIITRRDMKFLAEAGTKISSVMTKDYLVTAPANTSLKEAERILHEHKVEKLLLVDSDHQLLGLITMRDIEQIYNFPTACKDARGRLRIGAAVGVHDFERVHRLIKVGVDIIVVDSAHGHSANVINTVKTLRKEFDDLEVIAGNVTTGKGTLELIEAGASAIKVGVGPGSICTTRVIAGVGVPQISAIMDCAAAAKSAGIPILADGGVRRSGDMVKAIAAGANVVVMGSLFAGLDESPGQMVIYKGRRYKEYRGMGSQGAMVAGSASRYSQTEQSPARKLVTEGVEGRVPYRGKLCDFVYQFVGGLRAGMGYCGTANIDSLRQNAKFVRVSGAGLIESHPHDITITKESPNYSLAFEAEE